MNSIGRTMDRHPTTWGNFENRDPRLPHRGRKGATVTRISSVKSVPTVSRPLTLTFIKAFDAWCKLRMRKMQEGKQAYWFSQKRALPRNASDSSFSRSQPCGGVTNGTILSERTRWCMTNLVNTRERLRVKWLGPSHFLLLYSTSKNRPIQ
jgi:hypothetical protein